MKLSIVIPSRNEPYLQKTVEDIERNKRADTEVLVGEDIVPIGQRAMTNQLVRQAKGEYILKVDAHCSFGPGFDAIMLEEMDQTTILAPYLMPLNGDTWVINHHKKTSRYCFDQNLVMQYDQENDEWTPETMCLQGSAFMVHKATYWEWNLGDETLGSWGGQGPELGIKAFLNGGTCKTTKRTYYGHVFRHVDSDFPYDRGADPGKYANQELIKRYKNASIAPLIERFNYPADWTHEAVRELTG